jgi:hypothetical protein
MTVLRTLAIVACLALAACAAPAAQDPSQAQVPDAASSVPRKVAMPRTGGPQPPQRLVDMSCKVDADCDAKPKCVQTDCRCVRDTCIVKRDAVDPVIDPAPASSVR